MDDATLPGLDLPSGSGSPRPAMAADELESLILDAIRCGGGGLSRGADLFLASLCARTIADRLLARGLHVVRPSAGD